MNSKSKRNSHSIEELLKMKPSKRVIVPRKITPVPSTSRDDSPLTPFHRSLLAGAAPAPPAPGRPFLGPNPPPTPASVVQRVYLN
ncbi:hypothetical protein GWI33_014607 [Rhynchophorus ferrugineus]|uniref:Uncharacterized protein n=1 Tax=Rhynchophorus ferrugineus TaxID=354439 RepID=A0A834MAI3_RHYFE|nr:hypothetical protein GWI33_014607 [Rhynchophorus ferrugineus]